MIFSDAWERRVVEFDSSVNKKNVQAILYYDGGTASMAMPGYLKDEADAGDTMRRAWDTFCKDKPHLVNNIIEIRIIDTSDPDRSRRRSA
ncbi:MAG: hypothetical protein J6I68_15040 [Butyrivibrio sp.]|uniref:hypothetical protein n=1 Tax=Butyrivibrio sp. TaxID=28121 RepID=UPI001B4706C9|nr:hypothetical protein [Butyrivibrio sp.]MBP3784559.1 hypothetical protein [Butyrivibrio sp.]